ncbi:MAG: 3-isopropylmalate dehydrogenase [Chloroflexota bacterium]
MTLQLAVLPGDGIGPEVVDAALQVLHAVADLGDLELEYTKLQIGGAAIDAYGVPLRPSDLDVCRNSDAVLLGAVGGPQWDDLPVDRRPERALLQLRSGLDLGINFRPVRWAQSGAHRSPLKPEVAQDADIAFIRELTGGIYFGRPSYYFRAESGGYALDSASYKEAQIRAVLEFAFELAGSRRGSVTSVDKANVMNTSRLWRDVATAYGKERPDVALSHALVDSFAMSLMQEPRRFDVVVTENLFGDILTDLAGVIAGSLGLLPSASLRAEAGHRRFGMYEPIHGSAPDIAGQGKANPVGCILSVALMLEWSFDRADLAGLVRDSVDAVLDAGIVTADLAQVGQHVARTEEWTDALLTTLDERGGAHGRRNLRHHVA